MTHQRAHRRGQALAAGRGGGRAVRDFLGSHGLQYRTAAGVARRESAQVIIEVALDLALGLGDEAEALGIAHERSGGTDGE